MASSTTALRLRATDGRSIALLGGIGVAWSVIVLAEATGAAPALHHHALTDNGPPLPIAVALFLTAWLVMVVAMMVPASFGVIRGMADAGTMLDRPWQVPAGFLAGFLLVWSGFGLVAFVGDMGLHRVVDATPWLGARPWLIEAAVLALAGACQFAPLTRHCLEDCRRSGETPPVLRPGHGSALRLGFGHGLACLGATWALMLLMFAEGFDSLAWMVAITALMAWQSTTTDGRRATTVSGIVLLLAALTVLSGGAPVGA